MTLAITYHDPRGQLYDQLTRTIPILSSTFDAIAVQASPVAFDRSLNLLSAHGTVIQRDEASQGPDKRPPEKGRYGAIALALRTGSDFIMYCDGDRAMHWTERYPDELAMVAKRIPDHDFTLIGRTRRAFESHPRVQRDTEAITNHVFALVSDHDWDVTSAARGMSRRAAEAILSGCTASGISTDVVWPLHLLRLGGFSFGYLETEGSEFETGDRNAKAIAAAGGYEKWIEQIDSEPARWAHRLEAARIEVEAMVAYAKIRAI